MLPRYVVVLDLEAVCQRVGRPLPQEVIEIASVVVDTRERRIVDRVQIYVRPVVHPRLSAFCTELTGIDQPTIDAASRFPEALASYERWLARYGDETVFLTCGRWDLETALPRQAEVSGVALHPRYRRWIDLAPEFEAVYGPATRGLVGMMARLGLEFEGRRHSGLADCVNTARVALKMMDAGWC